MRSSGQSPRWAPPGSSGPDPPPLNGHLPGAPGTLLTLTPTRASPVQAAQKAAPPAAAGERLPEEKLRKRTGDYLTLGLFCLVVHTQGCLLGAGVGKERSKRHVHTHAHSHMYTHTHTHARTHMHTLTYTHTPTVTRTQTHMQKHPSAYTDTCTQTRTSTHAQTPSLTHTDTHLHTHTHTDTLSHTDTHLHTHVHRHLLSHTLILTGTQTHRHPLSHSRGDDGRRACVSTGRNVCAPAAWPCAALGQAGTCRRVTRLLLDDAHGSAPQGLSRCWTSPRPAVG